jgi:hypothetical protein
MIKRPLTMIVVDFGCGGGGDQPRSWKRQEEEAGKGQDMTGTGPLKGQDTTGAGLRESL